MLGWFTPMVFLGAAQRRMMRRGTLLLAYHKLANPPRATKDPYLYETKEMFSDQLRALRSIAARPGRLDQAQQGTPGEVVITFDDGTVDSLELGVPVLREHNFPAIQFLVSDRLGARNDWDIRKGDVAVQLMDASQVTDWLSAGHDIGSHTRTHPNLRHLSPEQARQEISGSKKILEDIFGREIAHFSYPYGSWNERVRDLVIEAGYRTACTMDFGVNSASSETFQLKRVFPLSSFRLLGKVIHRVVRRLSRATA